MSTSGSGRQFPMFSKSSVTEKSKSGSKDDRFFVTVAYVQAFGELNRLHKTKFTIQGREVTA